MASGNSTSIEERLSEMCAQMLNEMKEERTRERQSYEIEKQDLRDQLESLKKAVVSPQEAEKKDHLIQDQSTQIQDLKRQNARIRAEREDLVQRYATMSQRHTFMKKQASEYKTIAEFYKYKYDNSKDKVRHWQRFSNMESPPPSRHLRSGSGKYTLTPSIPRLLTPVSDMRSPKIVPEEISFVNEEQQRQDISEPIPHCEDGMSDEQIDDRNKQSQGAQNTSKNSAKSQTSSLLPSSQSTEDEGVVVDQDDSRVKQESLVQCGSSPQLVYEQPVRGRRPEFSKSMQSNAEGTGASDAPYLIKEGESESPNRSMLTTYPVLPQEGSGDLNEQTPILTPRKRRRLARTQSIRRANGVSHRMASTLCYDRAESLPHEMPQVGANDSVDPMRISFHETTPGEQPVNEAEGNPTNILQPIDANQQIEPRPHPPKTSRKRQYGKDTAIRQVAEDGQSFRGRPDAASPTKSSSVTERQSGRPRISALLEEPTSPNKHVVCTPVLPRGARPEKGTINQEAQVAINTPQAPPAKTCSAGNLTNSKVSAQATTKATLRANITNNLSTPPSATPPSKHTRTHLPSPLPSGETPNTLPRSRPQSYHPPTGRQHPSLRSLSPSRLTLADFKINPGANSDETYAYHETLRKASEKACRPGCTDPNCCGGYWRKFAELQYDIPSELNEDASLNDHQLLVNFLGGGPWAQQRAKSMNAKERREMILDARAAELAQRHGKHRQRFQRRRSPPGFWTTDFPNTQERGKEAEEVERMRAEMVRERWREALGEGGLWRFMDE